MTAPSSPRPEDVPPPPPPSTDEPDDDEAEEEAEEDDDESDDESDDEGDDQEAEARGEAPAVHRATAREDRPLCIDIDAEEYAREKDGYVSGLIVGIMLGQLSPHVADALAATMIADIALHYGVTSENIRANVEADAMGLLQDYRSLLRRMAS